MKKIAFGTVLATTAWLLPPMAGATVVAPATEAQIEQIRASMDDTLADSQSARFKDVTIITKTEGLRIVCGKVNSKNRYGGYVGYQTFFGMIGQDQNGKDAPHIMGSGEAQRRMCEDEISAAKK